MTDFPARRRGGLLVAAVAAVLLVIGGVAVARSVGGDDAGPDVAAPTSTTASTDASSPTSGGPITPGGSIGSCVERYDLTTLAHRELAFDGTVGHVDGDRVTFTVNHWYRGGGEPEVTLGGAEVLGGVTSAGPGASLTTGTRLLVAGDGGFAWSCGFTQPYDPDVAAAWQQTLSG